nr:GSCFA domain-containing protein [Ancylobacter koreensis]
MTITRESRVATAGSCFAQHIARHLQQAGFCHYIVEDGHPVLTQAVRQAQGYGLYSARYGNIYTARQLMQLMQRAYGEFTPEERAWIEPDGRVLDPFRPTVQPGGFVSIAEMERDRAQHLASVRRLFESCDVFVFTLGLTECWLSRADGAVFPVCPGVEGGGFDPVRHAFHNQTAAEVEADLTAFVERLKAVNPAAQIVLTVSPVPLVATAEPDSHVLAATTHAKAVLRVAAETVRRRYRHVHYFPSYEIVTGAHNRGRAFGADLRSVSEESVTHVMRLFLAHAAGVTDAEAKAAPPRPAMEEPDPSERLSARIVAVECDEEALDRPAGERRVDGEGAAPPPPPSPGGWRGAMVGFLDRTRIDSTSLKARIGGLDELRGLATLWVMLCHGGVLFDWLPLAIMGWGMHGVVLFFMVSGYLITRILIGQIRSGEPLAHFFVRRTLRIWPLMLVVLAVGAVAMPQFAHSVAFNLLLVNNYALGLGIEPVFRTDVMWSLAIEEQFYLLWPLVLLALGLRFLPLALFGIILAGFCFDAGLLTTPWPMPLSRTTYGCMQYITLGAAVALGRQGLYAALAAIAAFVGLFALKTGAHALAEFRSIWWGVTFALFAAVYLTVHWRPLLRSSFLAFTGRLCYGLYLIHFFISWLTLTRVGTGWIVPGAVYFAGSYALAIASLHLIEKPALLLRPALERSRRAQLWLLIAVLISAMVALISILSRLPRT